MGWDGSERLDMVVTVRLKAQLVYLRAGLWRIRCQGTVHIVARLHHRGRESRFEHSTNTDSSAHSTTLDRSLLLT
jgi:hypothetical protein